LERASESLSQSFFRGLFLVMFVVGLFSTGMIAGIIIIIVLLLFEAGGGKQRMVSRMACTVQYYR